MEVGVTCEESNVLELDEHGRSCRMCLIASVRLDPGLLQVSGQVEIDFLSRWNVYRMRPRLWATDEGIPVVLTKWVGVHSTDRDCAGKDHVHGCCQRTSSGGRDQ